MKKRINSMSLPEFLASVRINGESIYKVAEDYGIRPGMIETLLGTVYTMACNGSGSQKKAPAMKLIK